MRQSQNASQYDIFYWSISTTYVVVYHMYTSPSDHVNASAKHKYIATNWFSATKISSMHPKKLKVGKKLQFELNQTV